MKIKLILCLVSAFVLYSVCYAQVQPQVKSKAPVLTPSQAPVKTKGPASFKVAAVELNPQFMQFANNLPKIQAAVEEAAKAGAKLIVLPEMVTSGYIYKDREQINPYLDTIPGKTTSVLEVIAKKYHVYIAVGIAELDPVSNLAYNAAALVGPQGYLGKYRKNQLNSADTRWAARGNLGFPVFDTELGKIALVLCFDDSYIQSLLLPSLRGANIIAYLTASDRLYPSEKGSNFNHSTIANIAGVSGWVGTYIVATSRTDNEKNPETGMEAHYVGGASIWDPNGKRLAQAPVSTLSASTPAATIYAEVNPALYNNAAKQLQVLRHPELYQVLNYYREPINPEASTERHQINALMFQYVPFENNKKQNLEKISKMLEAASKKVKFNFAVLPENSLVGMLTPQQLQVAAEDLQGFMVQEMMKLARLYKSFIVFSMPEITQGKYYATALLIDDQGKLVGSYRKTHLNASDQQWAVAGNDLPVFSTTLGRVGLILGDEVSFPDLAAVFAANRADFIAVPSSWYGQYGGGLTIDPGLVLKPFPANTVMAFWYNLARYSQAYTLVANYVGGKQQYKGGSGLFSLNSVQGFFPPAVASDHQETALYISFPTLGASDWWINQDYLNIGQRVDLNVPLTLSPQSACYRDWVSRSTGSRFCWDN